MLMIKGHDYLLHNSEPSHLFSHLYFHVEYHSHHKLKDEDESIEERKDKSSKLAYIL
jgi:hypothetical protein